MNKTRRIELVRAMDTVARSLNDESLVNYWLSLGVADGDQDLSDDDMDIYVEDDADFKELMTTFTKLMKHAYDDGLYCDGVVSD